MTDYIPSTDLVKNMYAVGRDAIGISTDVQANWAEFDRWLAAHEAAIRADQNRVIARAIWDDEQLCAQAIYANPTEPHLNGRAMGLQRARDIAEAGGKPRYVNGEEVRGE